MEAQGLVVAADTPASLALAPALRAELERYALEGDPDEVCGILAGHNGVVERVFPVRNTADQVSEQTGVFRDRNTGVVTGGRKPVHYYMDPKDQLRVYNELDALDLDVVAYYHSHTFTEARPSPTDIRLATDLLSLYVLVGLQDKAHPSVRAWRIVKADPMDETGELVEVSVVSTGA